MGQTDHRAEVREFLSSRRARITPEQAGLPAYGGNRGVIIGSARYPTYGVGECANPAITISRSRWRGCMSFGEHHAAAPGRHPDQIPFRSLETSVFVTFGASSGDSALWAAVGCGQAG